MEIVYSQPSMQAALSVRYMHMTKLFRKSASVTDYIWKGKADNLLKYIQWASPFKLL